MHRTSSLCTEASCSLHPFYVQCTFTGEPYASCLPHHLEITPRSHATTGLVRRRIRVLRRGEPDLARGRVVHEVVALEPGHAVDELEAVLAAVAHVAHNEVDVVGATTDRSVQLQSAQYQRIRGRGTRAGRGLTERGQICAFAVKVYSTPPMVNVMSSRLS